jgi:hypothetical protein
MSMASGPRQRLENWARDRRSGRRYPIDAALEYRLVRQRKVIQRGTGHTVNISSSGILFEVEEPFAPGSQVEISIAWPARLNGCALLQLIVSGRTVRAEGGRTAVRIQTYDFRTKAASQTAHP